jgi:hypothetical protein
MSTGRAQECAARMRRRRARNLAFALTLALALVATTSAAAQAEPRSHAEFSCTAITVHYKGFPDLPGNAVRESVRIDKVRKVITKGYGREPFPEPFEFDGPEGVDTIPLHLGPGHHSLDVFSKWKTNGVRGGHDQPAEGGITCGAEQNMTVIKLQKLESGTEYVSAPLESEVGQTVEYEIRVTNTGNTPLLLEGFSDPHCDPGTISEGPGETPLPPAGPSSVAGSWTYFCTHKLTEAGTYTNTATATGVPQGCEECAPITRESNTVVVVVPAAPEFTVTKLQRITGPFTTEALSGEVGQTVAYEIVVTNTGNTTLVFAALSDERCDAGTLAGGPGANALAPGESATFTCSHVLTAADQAAGRYENTATETGEMPNGPPITHSSNTVEVTVPAPTGSSGGTPSGGTLSTSAGGSGAPEGGVLAFATSKPALSGPKACVRRAFAVSITSSGVLSVTFYLDGHKLRRLAAADARDGALTVYIRLAQLRRGRHRVVARITMRANAASRKASRVSRSLSVARCAAAAREPHFTG